jgi:hypothetical protein
VAKGEGTGSGGGELATCAERPGDPGVSTTEILISKLKALNVSSELVNDICEHAGDECNEAGGLEGSPISTAVCRDCREGLLWISDQ